MAAGAVPQDGSAAAAPAAYFVGAGSGGTSATRDAVARELGMSEAALSAAAAQAHLVFTTTHWIGRLMDPSLIDLHYPILLHIPPLPICM